MFGDVLKRRRGLGSLCRRLGGMLRGREGMEGGLLGMWVLTVDGVEVCIMLAGLVGRVLMRLGRQ
jgi:hypothetical protein